MEFLQATIKSGPGLTSAIKCAIVTVAINVRLSKNSNLLIGYCKTFCPH